MSKDNQQLDKILALADSNHDSEALVAVRMARQMLSRDGLSFSDLAKAASQRPRMNLPFGFFSSQNLVELETENMQLRREVDALKREKATVEAEAERERSRARDLEQKLSQSNMDALRWRQLARETVEKLWDLGQSMQDDDRVEEEPPVAKSA